MGIKCCSSVLIVDFEEEMFVVTVLVYTGDFEQVFTMWLAFVGCLYYSLFTDFTHCSSVSIDDFEQVNTGWENTKLMYWVWWKLNIGNYKKNPNNVLVYLFLIDPACFDVWKLSFWALKLFFYLLML